MMKAHAAEGSPTRRRLLKVGAGVFITLPILYLGICTLAIQLLSTPGRSHGGPAPVGLSIEFNEVRFPARGGDVQIAGWFFPREAGSRALVLVHGKDMSRASEFGGGFACFAFELRGRGFSVLMIDMRGHGQSGDSRFSFGINERRDIEGAVDWLKGRGFSPGSIGVLGISMGAASAIGAAADDQDIGAVVADSAYAKIYPIIERNWTGSSGLPNFFLPATRMMGCLMFGHDIMAASPVDEVGRLAPRPLLIIHNTGDNLIPVNDARELKAAYPPAELWEVSGGDHAQAYFADPRVYVDRVASFFERGLR
jgi:uncharacterized protein